MTNMLEGELACSWDLDDTLIAREAAARAFSTVKSIVRSNELPILTPDDLPSVSREIDISPLSGRGEIFAFQRHAMREVMPGVQEVLEYRQAMGAVHFGNTGRPNKAAWVEMSHETLKRGGISHLLQEVYFTKKGMKTAISKAAWVKELKARFEHVEHTDDNEETARLISLLFPHDKCYLIQYGFWGFAYLSKDPPNLRRISVIQETVA